MRRLAALLTVLFLLGAQAWAGGGREFDNTGGHLDGNYRATVKIHEPDKDEVAEAECRMTIQQKWVTLNIDGKVVKSKDAYFYDYGYKLEVDVRKDGWRYLVQVDRAK